LAELSPRLSVVSVLVDDVEQRLAGEVASEVSQNRLTRLPALQDHAGAAQRRLSCRALPEAPTPPSPPTDRSSSRLVCRACTAPEYRLFGVPRCSARKEPSRTVGWRRAVPTPDSVTSATASIPTAGPCCTTSSSPTSCSPRDDEPAPLGLPRRARRQGVRRLHQPPRRRRRVGRGLVRKFVRVRRHLSQRIRRR
jgi:hypothetical protein